MAAVHDEDIAMRNGLCGEHVSVKVSWRSGVFFDDSGSREAKSFVDTRLRSLLETYVFEGMFACTVLCMHLVAVSRRGLSDELLVAELVAVCAVLAAVRLLWAATFLVALRSLHTQSVARILRRRWLWFGLLRISPGMSIVFMVLYVTCVVTTVMCDRTRLDKLDLEVSVFFSSLCFLVVTNEFMYCFHTFTFPTGRTFVMTAVRKAAHVGGQGDLHENSGMFPCHQCSICLQDFETDTAVGVLPCGHVYHWSCVHKWFARDLTCPLKCPPPVSMTFARKSLSAPLLSSS
eukprot:TRINITY_DN30812_c0_g1_i1.p1 TRINITY_DN30812_c0_g1~~TRINITY_DN30812_c0_g1_i1.p1  ORF type:complete len:290 (-),score=24.89 TRINITY_DN30812_c0_g1_i1:282-1151(-)